MAIDASRTSSLLDNLPAVFQEDREGGAPNFLGRFLLGFEQILLGLGDSSAPGLEETIARLYRFFEPGATLGEGERAPAEFLRWLAGWVALTLREDWDELRQRDLIAKAVPLYRLRGTKRGVEEFLRIFTRLGVRIDEPGASLPPLPGAAQGGAGGASGGGGSGDPGGGGAGPGGPGDGGGTGPGGPGGGGTGPGDGPGGPGGDPGDGPGGPASGGDAFSAFVGDTLSAPVGDTLALETEPPPFFFEVHVLLPSTHPDEIKAQRAVAHAVVDLQKPAHTYYSLTVETPIFQIGVHSTVGVDTLLG